VLTGDAARRSAVALTVKNTGTVDQNGPFINTNFATVCRQPSRDHWTGRRPPKRHAI